MAKVGLIFTTDYEIFGNASGTVEDCVIAPAARMASLLEKYDARMTVFFEVGEYWAFQQEFVKGSLEKDWAGKMKDQAQAFLRKGHDVQLHLHPQWLDYTYRQGRWNLNYKLWRLPALAEDRPKNVPSLTETLKRGQQTLERLGREVNPQYHCDIFRAGAWCIQPEEAILAVLRELNFRIDSTVAPGLHFRDALNYYDFRAVQQCLPFPIQQSVTAASASSDLWEFPIYTSNMALWRRLKFLIDKKRRRIPFFSEGCKGRAMSSSNKNYATKLAEVLGSSRRMFTYGDATTTGEMKWMCEDALKKYSQSPEEIVPLVCISHPKTFANFAEFEKFLAWAEKHPQIEFSTYRNFLEGASKS